jgi:4-hydroxybenzoyl-CoA reductase subunit beta
VLRLPQFRVEHPTRVEDAVALLAEHGERAVILAGGTDLVPNMKHELFTPEVVVALAGIAELRGIRATSAGLAIGAMTTLDELSASAELRAAAPVLAQAAGLVAGPQLRRMGTLGGNVMLDTRCQWYNQTYFWREALGFCLKKDGALCHVVAGGQKCVAAASNDTAPALMSLGATLVFAGPAGRRELAIDALWQTDGIWNKKADRGELLVEVKIPRQVEGHRGAYGKLRDRGSIDFPLLGVAARLDAGPDGRIVDADVVVVALQARPHRVPRAKEELAGHELAGPAFAEALERVAAEAKKRCRPLANVPGDADYRQRMVPVLVRRTLQAAALRAGPVHGV